LELDLNDIGYLEEDVMAQINDVTAAETARAAEGANADGALLTTLQDALAAAVVQIATLETQYNDLWAQALDVDWDGLGEAAATIAYDALVA